MSSTRIFRQTETLSSGGSTISVTLSPVFGAGETSYSIICELPFQTSYWITNKTNTGFTFNVGTTTPYDKTIGFFVVYEDYE